MKRRQAAKFRNAVMAAHQLGIQKGAAMASAPKPPMGPPPAPPPGAGGPPMQPGAGAPPPGMGMSHGGAIRKAAKALMQHADAEDREEKGKKMCGGGKVRKAKGGTVRGGRGDGCAMKGFTKGRVC